VCTIVTRTVDEVTNLNLGDIDHIVDLRSRCGQSEEGATLLRIGKVLTPLDLKLSVLLDEGEDNDSVIVTRGAGFCRVHGIGLQCG